MGVEPFLVSAAVRAFLAQRLVRKLCDHCKVPRDVTQAERESFSIPDDIQGQAYAANGCDRCRDTGFSGRLAIYEVVVLGQTMQDLVAHGSDGPTLRAQAVTDGYIPMRGYGWFKVMQGVTTMEEVIAVTATDGAGD